jgi:hypothetical protein
MWEDLNASAVSGIALRATALVIIVTSVEYLRCPLLFADGGPLSWPVSRLGSRLMCGRLGRLFTVLHGYPNVLWLIRARLALAILVLVWPHTLATTGPLTLVAIAFMGRSRYGLDGADQLSLFVLGSYCVLHVLGIRAGGRADDAFAILLTLQMMLCYATAGLWKLRSRRWRDGSALSFIAWTEVYGSRQLARLLAAARPLAPAAAWGVILWESGFPIVVLLPDQLGLCYLAGGVFLHVGIAVFMGLNDFLLVFIGTYPAVLYVETLVSRYVFDRG